MSEDEPTDATARQEPVDALESHPSGAPGGSGRRGLLTAFVVVLALAAAGLTGVALARGGGPSGDQSLAASTGSSSASPSAKAPNKKKKALKRLARGERHGFGPLGLGAALHGTWVVPDGSGGYTTMVMQHGKASAVSGTSITVTSDDGFAQTYAITGTTGVGADRLGTAGIDNGADVIVIGTKKGDVVTAEHLIDLAAFRDRGPGGMGGFDGPRFGGPGGPGLQRPDGEAPTPSQSGATEGSTFGA